MEEEKYIELIKQSEQLRILKNYVKNFGITKYDVERLIEAMEMKEEKHE